MDANSHSVSPELSLLTNNLAIPQTRFSPSCALCHTLFISDNNEPANFEAINIFDDCKFLLLEDLGTPMRDYQTRSWIESRRSKRVHSDAESDGVDSLFEETESITGYRNINRAYGGNFDASVDGNTYVDNDHSSGSDFETHTDIDPMHAGIYNWNSHNE
ncbi:uncharacterized protein LOC114074001 [Solanum pennellii]|uniref:Uncharacterized protein LOC114074001 n=1 Tax=Solanum pennellii TaxID=28526 RepID=A0ABM1UW58_SOLPN|nr:uncharacterized protein LOC114074001 [Solanum pennellii]